MITIYGIKACDSCKKAILHFAGRANFEDIRSNPLNSETLEAFISYFGDGLINKRSKTWKALSPEEKLLNLGDLLKKFPTVMKRPIIECSQTSQKSIGWSTEVKNQYR